MSVFVEFKLDERLIDEERIRDLFEKALEESR
jgi:hypothetical protein